MLFNSERERDAGEKLISLKEEKYLFDTEVVSKKKKEERERGMTELQFRQRFSSLLFLSSLSSLGILLGEEISLFTLPFPLFFHSTH